MDRRKEKGVGNMIDLEQVKKRVEEIAGTRGFCNCCEGTGRRWVAGKIHRATYSEATMRCPGCGGSGKMRLDEVSTDELLSLTHDLIAGNETLQREKAELEIEKNIPPSLNIRCCEDGVWLELKATTGRSACINLSNMGKEHQGDSIAAAILDWCRDTAQENRVALERNAELGSKLEAQQKVIDAFGSNVDGVDSLVTEIIEQRSLKLQVAELESRLCGMKELYELHQSNRPDLPFAVRAKIVFRMEEIFQQAFSSAPECKHEQELMKHIGEESALACEGAKAVAIFKDKQIAALQA